MNSLFKRLAILLVMHISVSITTAKCDASIPAIVWEQHPEVAALSLVLKDHFLLVSVKNTSNASKKLINQGSETFVKPFYIDVFGALTPLGEHKYYNDERDYSENGPVAIDIAPSQEFSEKISLTPDECAKLKTSQVISHVIIYDPATSQRYTIESSPKLLTETDSK
jgi:hypothetical protein